MRARSGFVLASSLFILFVLLSGIVIMSVLSVARLKQSRDAYLGECVFYLSESGIETAKSALVKDPSFVTDPPVAANDKKQLLYSCKGKIYLMGQGGFKLIKPAGIDRVYSIGFLGKDPASSSHLCYQSLEHTLPYSKISWKVF